MCHNKGHNFTVKRSQHTTNSKKETTNIHKMIKKRHKVNGHKMTKKIHQVTTASTWVGIQHACARGPIVSQFAPG